MFIPKKSCACVHTTVCVTACGSMSGTRGRPGPAPHSPPHPSCVRPIAVPSRCMNPVLRPPPRTVSLLPLGPCCPRSSGRGSPAATRGLPAPPGQVPAPPETLRCPHLLTHPLFRETSCSAPISIPVPPRLAAWASGPHGPRALLSLHRLEILEWEGGCLEPLGCPFPGPQWMLEQRAGVGGPTVGGRQGSGTEGAGRCEEEGGSQPRRTPHPSPRLEVHSEALTGLRGYTVQDVSSPRRSLAAEPMGTAPTAALSKDRRACGASDGPGPAHGSHPLSSVTCCQPSLWINLMEETQPRGNQVCRGRIRQRSWHERLRANTEGGRICHRPLQEKTLLHTHVGPVREGQVDGRGSGATTQRQKLRSNSA